MNYARPDGKSRAVRSGAKSEAKLKEWRTCKDFLQVQAEGYRAAKRNIPNYDLDIIIDFSQMAKELVPKYRTYNF